MSLPVPVVILWHPRERLAKCTLAALRGRPGLTFLRAGPDFRFDATGHTLLGLEGPPLGPPDAGRPLLLLDATWRLLAALTARLDGEPVRRSLPPGLLTAYPRRSKLEPDPPRGLASVEALFAALCLLGWRREELLQGYRWAGEFLARNAAILPPPAGGGVTGR